MIYKMNKIHDVTIVMSSPDLLKILELVTKSGRVGREEKWEVGFRYRCRKMFTQNADAVASAFVQCE